jgi:hypothetical protein
MLPASHSLAGERRRAGPRVAFWARAKLAAGEREPIAAATLDIGLGGACVQVQCGEDLEAVKGLEIAVGRRPLSTAVRVAWQRRIGGAAILGLQFLEVDIGETALIWEVLNRRALELTRFIVEHSSVDPVDVDVAMDMALRTRRREIAPQEYLYRQGTDGPERSIFIVASGSVELEVRRRDGEVACLDRAVSGDVFGGLPMMTGSPHVDSARALEPVQLLEIDDYSISDLLVEKPIAGRAVERAIFSRYLTRFQALGLGN